MSLQCLIRYSKDGEATVLNENDTVSKLYEDALEYTGNQDKALAIWATASLDEFSDRIGVVNKNDEATLEDVLVFMDSEKVEESPLSNLEKVQLKQVMYNLGYERLSDLSKTLNDIFKPGKVVVSSLEEIDYKALNKSKLYNATELSEIDLDEIEDLINKIDNQLLKEDVVIPKNESPATYRNSNYKTILGTYELVSEEKIDQDIRDLIEDFSSEKEFTDKIQQLPYSDFVQKFYTDKTFAKELMDKYKTLKKVSVLSIIDGKLVDTKTSTRATIANTITDEIDVIGLEVKIDYLESIDEDLWVLAEQGVRKYLKKIENDLVKEGVDVIGLASNYRSREAVIDLLKSLNTVANQAQENRLSQEALDDFSQKHDALIKKPNATSIESLPENIKGLKIVKLYSNLSLGELYDNYGLIKVGENLYQYTNKNDSIMLVKDYIYNRIIDGEIPSTKIIGKESMDWIKTNKEASIKKIELYINSVDTGFPVNDKEGYVARQIAYGHPQVSEANYPQNIKKLATVKTDPRYLKTDFVVDFYKYILEEKAKDSKTYRDILSNFQVTDRDITAVRPIKSIEGIKYEQELSDYIRLMRDTNLKHLVEVENNFVPDALYYMNNLETLGEFTTERPTIDSGYVIISPNPSNYIKVGGKLYEKALSNEEADLYAEMILSKDTTYLQLEKEIKFDKEKAVKVLEGYNKKTQQKPTLSQFAEIKQKAGVETPLYKKIIEKSITMFKASLAPKTLEQKVDQTFEKNLVEFIRDKGVDVITDKQEIEKALAESGYIINPQVTGYHGTPVKNVSELSLDNIGENNGRNTFGWGIYSNSLPNFAKRYVSKDRKGNLSGSLLTLDIKDDNFEVWDKPVSKTTAKKITSYLKTNKSELRSPNLGESYRDYYNYLRSKVSEKEASLFMKSAGGVEGVKVSMQAGKSGDEATAVTYVVYDESVINVKEIKNFIQTPAGNVLGFEKDGKIYLDEEQLNNVTTLHELAHTWQSMLEIRASKGDKKAQEIINKREEVFSDLAEEWINFHKGNVGVGNLQEMIIGEKAANKISDLKNKLKEAKGLVAKGAPMDIVEKNTGWFKVGEDWRYFSKNAITNLKIKTTFTPKLNSKEDITNVVDDNILFEYYPQLKNVKIEFYEGPEDILASEKEGTIRINTNRNFETLNSPAYLRGLGESIGGILPEESYEASIGHELSHIIQKIEGLPRGGSKGTAIQEARLITKEDRPQLGYLIEAIDKKLTEEGLSENETKILDYAKYVIEEGVYKGSNTPAWDVYNRIYGEVEARTLELIKNQLNAGMSIADVNFLDIQNKLLDAEGIDKNDTFEVRVTGYNFNIIGERGAAQLDQEKSYRVGNLLTAKEMTEAGKDPKSIRLATGWEQMNGEWMYEVDDVKLADNFEPEVGKEYNYLDVVKPNDFTKAYPELENIKIKFNNNGTNSFSADGTTINLDAEGLTTNVFGSREQPSSTPFGTRGFTPVSKSSRIEKILNHESSHYAQWREGFYTGGSPSSIVRRGFELAGVQEEDDFKTSYLKVYNKYNESGLSQSDKNILRAYLLEYKPVQGSLAKAYSDLAGEAVARNVERRMDLSPQERINLLLKDTETDVREEDKIFLRRSDFNFNTLSEQIGLDLSSPVYAQRSSESDAEYKTRLLKEVEAYVTAPKVAEKLENLRKENPSLWQKIMDFIQNLKNWLKGEIGLSDYKGDIFSMSKEEYIDALGISVLKDDYKGAPDLGPSFNYNIVGAKAAQNNKIILDNFNKALDLEQQGKSAAEIELETGWYKEEGDWKYFSKEILQNYKPKNITIELGKEYNLEDVIDNEELFTLYPQLRTQKTKFYNGAKRDKEINTSRDTEVTKGVFKNGSIFLNVLWENPSFTRAITSEPRYETLDKFRDCEYDGTGGLSRNIIVTLAQEVKKLAQRTKSTILAEEVKYTSPQPQIPFSEKQRMARDLGTILELKPELVSLYQQEDAEEIFNKMENCGG